MTSVAERIIDKFGGQAKLARALGRPPSTIQKWKDGKFIPSRHQAAVLEAAQRLEIDLSHADFFPLPGDEVPGKPAARAAA